jgi:hypothetical protein
MELEVAEQFGEQVGGIAKFGSSGRQKPGVSQPQGDFIAFWMPMTWLQTKIAMQVKPAIDVGVVFGDFSGTQG